MGNRFAIRLRAMASLLDNGVREEKKRLILQNVEQVKAKGFPNCFGVQRFGKGMKNFWEAEEVLC
jgi:tRNA(Glu) U13 pseudouridine synthase TruD